MEQASSEEDTPSDKEDCHVDLSFRIDTGLDDVATNARFPWRREDVEARYWLADGLLGSGGSGIVRYCIERATGIHLACKTVRTRGMSSDKQEALCAEILLMGGLPPHPHIVNLSAVHEDSDSIHIIMELCSGDLFNLICQHGCFTENDAAWIFRQVASAVAVCHDHAVAHLDVKPENILIARNELQGAEVKLADFGQAVLLKAGHILRGFSGSIFYMAPEVIEGKPYNLAADVWSLGVLLYVILAGYLPFWSEEPKELFSLIRSSEINFQSHPWPLISDEVITLIRLMMTRVPESRPTVHEILSHPWLQPLTHPPSLQPSHRLLNSIEILSVSHSVATPSPLFDLKSLSNPNSQPNPNPSELLTNHRLNPDLLSKANSPSKPKSLSKPNSHTNTNSPFYPSSHPDLDSYSHPGSNPNGIPSPSRNPYPNPNSNPNPSPNRNPTRNLPSPGCSNPSKSLTMPKRRSLSLLLNPFYLLNSLSFSPKNSAPVGQREPSPKSPFDFSFSPPATPSGSKNILSPPSIGESCVESASANQKLTEKKQQCTEFSGDDSCCTNVMEIEDGFRCNNSKTWTL